LGRSAKRSPAPRRHEAAHALDAIFRPRSVAVIGASRRAQSIGHEILRNLVEFGFEGPVFPVNPAARVVRSMRAYKSLDAIEGAVDLAVVVVPRDQVLGVVDACGRRGVRGLVTITAGFREVGDEGAELERRIAAKLKRHGMRMVGPNCMGVINTEPGVRLNATFAATTPRRGNVGFVSQSGALGEAILADAVDCGIGVAMFVSMGNKVDVSGNDLLEYWEDNDDVQAILMYLESFGNPRRFAEIARRVTRKKPVITVKAGRTAAGARAASSHTGSIVGLDFAVDSLLEQCGVLRVSTMGEMFVQATTLANQPIPRGNRVAIVTNAGGPGILCTDACVARGLAIAELAPATRKALAARLPPEASLANPVDMIASADAERYRWVLQHVREDPAVDAVIAIFVSPIMIDAFEVARAIAEAADGAKPVLSVFMGRSRSAEGVDELRRHRVPVYRFPEEAASALAAASRYRELRDAPHGHERTFRCSRARARQVIAAARREGRRVLSPEQAERLLGAYGLPTAPSRLAGSSAEAIAAAQELGYPVVLKAASATILHKTDAGGVRLDLRNADEVGRAWRELTARLAPRARDLRVQVQLMVAGGREVILGMTRDPQFGSVILFGLGGIHVEAIRDVSVRLHPLTDVDARSMIEGVRGYPLLAGYRGAPPVALDLIEEALLRLSQLVGDLEGELAELDINPFIVTPERARSSIVDARVILSEAPRGGEA
jgi:acetyl coenzyme A synthetase (ADP forming)-like protein